MGETLIQVEGLSFTYPDGTRALDDVSFAGTAGEKVALAGPNGAGKSTLLLTLCGVLHDGFEGSVKVFGLPVEKQNVRQIQRKLGLVFQNPDDQLFCSTIFDDVAFGPRNLKLSEDEVSRRVDAALAAVDLVGLGRRSPFHLSLGERKRAAIATVLSMQPELLALDEPTSMLDPRGRKEVSRLLKSLGGTQIIITHDMGMIADLCDRVVIPSRGRLVADDRPAGVLSNLTFLELHGLA